MPNDAAPCVWTIGHSTRPLHKFLQLLKAHGIRLLVDVRTIPRSRHNPQFNTEALEKSLEADALVSRGWTVRHILSTTAPEPHQLTSFAKLEEVMLIYPRPIATESTPRLF